MAYEATPKNLGEETGRFFSTISERYYEFGKSKLLKSYDISVD